MAVSELQRAAAGRAATSKTNSRLLVCTMISSKVETFGLNKMRYPSPPTSQ